MPVGRVPAAMASAMAGFSPASRARRRCAWNSYWAVHLRPAMMIASSLSRGEIELPNRTNAPTRWTRSHSSGLRKSALNGPRRPAPRGPDWMAPAPRLCCVALVPRSLDDRLLLEPRRERAADPHERPHSLDEVAQRRAPQERVERPAKAGAARARLDGLRHALLLRRHRLGGQRRESSIGHRYASAARTAVAARAGGLLRPA